MPLYMRNNLCLTFGLDLAIMRFSRADAPAHVSVIRFVNQIGFQPGTRIQNVVSSSCGDYREDSDCVRTLR